MFPASTTIQPRTQHRPITPNDNLMSPPRRIPLADISNFIPPQASDLNCLPVTAKPTSDPIPGLFRKTIRYDQKWNIFICREHGYAIDGVNLGASNRHLHEMHGWSIKDPQRRRKLLWNAVNLSTHRSYNSRATRS